METSTQSNETKIQLPKYEGEIISFNMNENGSYSGKIQTINQTFNNVYHFTNYVSETGKIGICDAIYSFTLNLIPYETSIIVNDMKMIYKKTLYDIDNIGYINKSNVKYDKNKKCYTGYLSEKKTMNEYHFVFQSENPGLFNDSSSSVVFRYQINENKILYAKVLKITF